MKIIENLPVLAYIALHAFTIEGMDRANRLSWQQRETQKPQQRQATQQQAVENAQSQGTQGERLQAAPENVRSREAQEATEAQLPETRALQHAALMEQILDRDRSRKTENKQRGTLLIDTTLDALTSPNSSDERGVWTTVQTQVAGSFSPTQVAPASENSNEDFPSLAEFFERAEIEAQAQREDAQRFNEQPLMQAEDARFQAAQLQAAQEAEEDHQLVEETERVLAALTTTQAATDGLRAALENEKKQLPNAAQPQPTKLDNRHSDDDKNTDDDTCQYPTPEETAAWWAAFSNNIKQFGKDLHMLYWSTFRTR